ncbi:hypothetical protein SH139x_003366 [Planctomycetaceae bacterium SH139]
MHKKILSLVFGFLTAVPAIADDFPPIAFPPSVNPPVLAIEHDVELMHIHHRMLDFEYYTYPGEQHFWIVMSSWGAPIDPAFDPDKLDFALDGYLYEGSFFEGCVGLGSQIDSIEKTNLNRGSGDEGVIHVGGTWTVPLPFNAGGLVLIGDTRVRDRSFSNDAPWNYYDHELLFFPNVPNGN